MEVLLPQDSSKAIKERAPATHFQNEGNDRKGLMD